MLPGAGKPLGTLNPCSGVTVRSWERGHGHCIEVRLKFWIGLDWITLFVPKLTGTLEICPKCCQGTQWGDCEHWIVGSNCRKIKSFHVWPSYELGLFDKPDVVATIFINNKVATGKTEWYSFGEMHWWWITVWLCGWGFPWRNWNHLLPAVLRRGQWWGGKSGVRLTDLPGRVPPEALRHSLGAWGCQERQASSGLGEPMLGHSFILFLIHCPRIFIKIWSVSCIFWLLMSCVELWAKVFNHSWGKGYTGEFWFLPWGLSGGGSSQPWALVRRTLPRSDHLTTANYRVCGQNRGTWRTGFWYTQQGTQRDFQDSQA